MKLQSFRSTKIPATSIAVTAALIGGLLVTAATASAATASTAATAPVVAQATATATTKDVCSAPAAGEASCFALKRTDLKTITAAANASPNGYGPANLQSAYNLPSATGGAGQTVALIEAYDDPNAESDLAVYRTQFGLSACTTANGCFRKVNETGQTSPLPDPTGSLLYGWDGELSLDEDMVSAACPNCHILIVEANAQSSDDLYTSVNTAVSLGAGFVSMSFGIAETPGDLNYDSEYLTHPGVVMTASTGDSGYGVSFPGAAENVVSVGGTSLSMATNSRGWAESAWSGAGSGCSQYESVPAYQKGVAGCSTKADADISAVANPNTGVAVYQTYGDTGWDVYGGTSVASPLVAAAYALAGTRPATDSPGSDLYAHQGSLHDIVSGSNGVCSPSVLCTAGSGWDGPTGLGTPNGTSALAASGGSTPPTPIVTVTNPGSQTSAVKTPVNLSIQAVDSAGLSLTYRASGLPTGLSISPATGLITGTPTTAATSNVTITVADSVGAAGSANFAWTIKGAGSAPVTVTITNPGDQASTVNGLVSLPITGTDSAGLALTFAAGDLPPGLAIDPGAGSITGAPTTAGLYQVTVTASDSSGASASAIFLWTVSSPSAPPACSDDRVYLSYPTTNPTVALNAPVSIQLNGWSTCGNAITYSASGLPTGVSLNGVTGLISGTPRTAGVYSGLVTATDTWGSSWTGHLIITVTVPAPPPTVVTVTNPGNQTSVVNAWVTKAITASTTAGSISKFYASGLPSGTGITNGGTIEGTPTVAGTYPVTITAVTAANAQGSTSFTWTVTAASTGGGTGGGTGSVITLKSYVLPGSYLLNPGATLNFAVPYGTDGLPTSGVSSLQLAVQLSGSQAYGTITIGAAPATTMSYTGGGVTRQTILTSVGTGTISVKNNGQYSTHIQLTMTGYTS